MKIKSVLDYLKEDKELTTLLNHTELKPKISPYTAYNKNDYPYIIVTLEPFDTDVLIGKYRCEIRIVTNDDLQIEKLTDLIINRFHFANRPTVRQGNNLIYTSSHAGGSLLIHEKEEVYEQVLFFNIQFNRK